MANQTPEGHFEYPDLDNPRWYENGRTITVDGVTETQSHDGIVDWLEQHEIRHLGIEQSWSDLPANDPDKTDDRTGNERVYFVRDDDVLVRDTGTDWRIVAGRGSSANPVPSITSDAIDTQRGTISAVETVTPADDWQTVYADAEGPVYFGPGIYEPTSTFEITPGKPVIGWLSPPNEESVGTRFKNMNALNPMAKIVGDPDGISSSNHPAISGIFFDGDNQAARMLDITSENAAPRNVHIDQCVFREIDSVATVVDGPRGARFIDCYWEDCALTNTNPVLRFKGGAKYFTIDNCQFVTCGKGIDIVSAQRGCRITNTRFSNIDDGYRINVATGGGSDEEWSLTIDDCNFVDFGAAQNAISITDTGADGPIKIVNCDFDGINRSDGTATGNKAINIANVTLPGGLVVKNNSVANFTNGPEIALRDALPNTKLGGNQGQSEFRDRGTATISSGTTSVSVSHGMDADIQSLADVSVTPAGDLGAATYWYTSDPTAGDGSFDINVDADPTQSVTFKWETKVGA